jgi:2-dehydro-3-deoxyphosphogluconate aldolase / (4S)-4-hydroxy-2-oxoglutarate aldolase
MDQQALGPRLKAVGVVPVVTIDDAGRGPDLAAALARGGLPLAEITFRTDAAAGAIASIRRSVPDVLVGAGTVLDVATVDRAIEAGAEFIVAPGLNPIVVEYCLAQGIAVLPGVATPTEIEMALSRGIRLLKFFPAEAMGGIAYIKAVAAPYREARFVPTGGVSAVTLASYLALPAVAACGGTWIATADAIREGRWDEIVRLAAQAMAIVRQARPAA